MKAQCTALIMMVCVAGCGDDSVTDGDTTVDSGTPDGAADTMLPDTMLGDDAAVTDSSMPSDSTGPVDTTAPQDTMATPSVPLCAAEPSCDAIPPVNLAPTLAWTFDDWGGMAGAVADEGRPTNDSTVVGGGVRREAGPVGFALALDGVAGHVQTADKPGISANFAVAMWVRIDALTAGEKATLFSWGSGPSSCTGTGLFVDDAGTVTWFGYGAGGCGDEVLVEGTTPLCVGQWSHVTITHQAGQLTLYVDGQPAGAAAAPEVLVYGDNPFRVGDKTAGSIHPLAGAVDEVAIYELDASGAALAHALYNAGACGLNALAEAEIASEGLAAHFTPDGLATGLLDSWVTDTGTVTASATGDNRPTVIDDAGQRWVSFDGVDDRLDLSSRLFAHDALPAHAIAVFRTSDTAGHIVGTGSSEAGFLTTYGAGLLVSSAGVGAKANNAQSDAGFMISEASDRKSNSGATTIAVLSLSDGGATLDTWPGNSRALTTTAPAAYPYTLTTVGASDGAGSGAAVDAIEMQLADLLIYDAPLTPRKLSETLWALADTYAVAIPEPGTRAIAGGGGPTPTPAPTEVLNGNFDLVEADGSPTHWSVEGPFNASASLLVNTLGASHPQVPSWGPGNAAQLRVQGPIVGSQQIGEAVARADVTGTQSGKSYRVLMDVYSLEQQDTCELYLRLRANGNNIAIGSRWEPVGQGWYDIGTEKLTVTDPSSVSVEVSLVGKLCRAYIDNVRLLPVVVAN